MMDPTFPIYENEDGTTNVDNQYKRCPNCLIRKSVTEFYRDDRTRDGLTNQCKTCRLNYQRRRQGSATKLAEVNQMLEDELKWWKSTVARMIRSYPDNYLEAIRNIQKAYHEDWHDRLLDTEDGWLPNIESPLPSEQDLKDFLRRGGK